MSTEERVTVGNVEKLASRVQKYALPFQSLWQTQWFVICILLVVFVLFALDHFVFFGRVQLRGWLLVALGAVAGALPAWTAVLPSRFCIYVNSDATRKAVIRFIEEYACRLGYSEREAARDQTVLFRKSKYAWKENRLRIAFREMDITVTGPTFAIDRLHRVSKREFGVP